MTFKELFKTLYAIDVSGHIEKKKTGQIDLSYLSWAWAVKVFTENVDDWDYSDPTYEYDDDLGYMVSTTITVRMGDETKEKSMWLPVMDGANKAMKKQPYTYKTKFGEKTVEAATVMDLNKAYMRCLVKNMSLFGLGLCLYQGEDLPQTDEGPKAEAPKEYNVDEDPGEPATPRQIEVLKKLPQNVQENIINHFGLETLDEISKAQASDTIAKLRTKQNG